MTSDRLERRALGPLVAAIIFALAGCTPTPPPQTTQPVAGPGGGSAACQAGGDARGIAAGFFAFFQDRPECF